MVHQYDPGLNHLTFRRLQLQGFFEGTYITAERLENTFEPSVGSDGRTTRVRNRNQNGRITFVLQAESEFNDLLSAIAREDELFGTGLGAVQLTNLNSTLIISAGQAWIVKPPTVEQADTAKGREWMLHCDVLNIHVGGAVV